MTIAKIGGEFRVNSTTLNEQMDSSVAVLTDGRFVVTYSDFSQSGGDTSGFAIRTRIFNADGSESVPEFLVNTTTLNAQRYSQVAALADGSFVVTWTDASVSGGDTSGNAIRSRIFNADGTQTVPEFLVNTTTLGGQDDSSVTALADGRFVVTYTDFSQTGGDTSDFAVRARIFNADGTQSVPEFVVNTTTISSQYESQVTALADGRFVVTYTDFSFSGADASGTAIRAQIFNPDGTQSVPEFLVNTTTSNEQMDSSVAALANGSFVVTWTDFSLSGGDTTGFAVRARIFNADGIQSVPEFLVNTTTLGDQADSTVTALADGRFVVTYRDGSVSGGDTSSNAIRARIFNADGTQSVPEFLVNTTTTNEQSGSSVAALADGRFVVTWTDLSNSGDDTSFGAVRSQVFDPTIYDGTSVGETVTGGAFDDRYSGYGGNDTLSGRGGDDRLNGGEGDDTLNGDDGNDTLDGGNNGDTLNGGAGNDFLYGRAGIDILNGGNGGDHLWGGAGVDQHTGGDDASIDYARYDDANWGNLTIRLDGGANVGGAAVGDTYNGIEGLVGGLGNDTVVGNGSNNYLFGGGGADLIYGKDGADYLSGDAGGDNLWGGLGADQHIGGNDAGIDYARYDDANYGNLTIRLDGGANVGAAAVGDTYNGIEGLVGGLGIDVIVGNGSANYLFGGGNNDYIDARGGNDYMNGGGGADRFVFATALGAGNIDTIADFQHLTDDIVLNAAIFAAVGASLTADEIAFGTAAADSNDFIVYNSANGRLYYDANGSVTGGAGQIQFATITAGTTLTFDDFVVA